MAGKRNTPIERDDDLDASDLGFGAGGSGGGPVGSGGGSELGSSGGDGGGDGRIDPASLTGGPGKPGEPGAGTDAFGTAFDPGKHTGKRNADGSWRLKKKGRSVPLGRDLPVSTIEMFLVASHLAMANLTNSPELELRGSEPHDLAVPIQKVAGLYNMTVDPRLEAYGMLIIAAVSVYGPKLQKMRARVKASRPPKGASQTQAAPVFTSGGPRPVTEPAPKEVGNGEIVFGKLN